MPEKYSIMDITRAFGADSYDIIVSGVCGGISVLIWAAETPKKVTPPLRAAVGSIGVQRTEPFGTWAQL